MSAFAWRLYYEDGSIWDESDGFPVPRRRIVCIAQPCAEGCWHTVLTNGDWYLFRGDRGYWTEHTDAGAWAELEEDAHNIICVRQGKYVSREKFHACWARARSDVKGE